MPELEIPLDGQHAFFGGKWVTLRGVERIPMISPSDESLIGHIAAAQAEHVDQAVAAITPALAEWRAMGVAARSKILLEYGRRIENHIDELTAMDVRDGGMTHGKAYADVKRSVKWISDYCGYALDLTGRTFPSAEGTLSYTTREPYGIVGQIVPFNHPQNFAVKGIAPTVIAGNAVILKPPEQASMSALGLAELARDVFPPGIVNVVTGYGHEVGSAIVAHPDIPRIGFVGSVPTGRRILEAGAARIKHITLELGGKNPLILTDGPDADFAAQVAVRGMNLSHAGQSCQSTSRALVHASIYDEVVERIADRMSKLRIGNPVDPETDMGPLAFKDHYDRVLRYIDIGVRDDGATLSWGGGRPDGLDRGYFVQPALFSEVTPDMRIAREEIFGPVLSVIRWESDEEAVAIADDTEMGLNCRIFSPSVERSLRIGNRLSTGMCYVNTRGALEVGQPFGGFRQSGIGKQNCHEEVVSYTRERSFVVGLD